MKSPTAASILLLLSSLSHINAFVPGSTTSSVPFTRACSPSLQTSSTAVYNTATGRPDFEFSFEVPKKGIADVGTAEVKLPPLLKSSEIIVVRYDLPFGLNAAPDAASGQVVVTQDGKSGGEQVGDILRQTTYWRGKEPGIFDVSKNAANFDLVIQALVTNDLSVADDIVLVFERPL
jgi:hypothetical protein|mmetsp:Transcript_966/g.1802  ORF Transcript_966/g.1802 Transcript_966/m.1802 type:complete len:177 (-) Transcript_966:135-665(-)|eukprot:CAMPEP_0198287828 /NCGR_PEP_ID=MMETSP1449-20131203/6530_1 /TAXON_ID=420275 /ORGANISM="Attheya septentrionalis, Strain CCMP2084" /LENGTH=176 /DNA_ID=CAMNT_0043985871 /DNA_START=112 /DNA_END=642 /DNA_ORIENTATION=+